MIIEGQDIPVNNSDALSSIIVSQKMEFVEIEPVKKAIDYSHLRKTEVEEPEVSDDFVPIEEFAKKIGKDEINLFPPEDNSEPQSLLYAYIANKVSAYRVMISESANHNIQDYV